MKSKCSFFWFGQTWQCIRKNDTQDEFFGGECIPTDKVIHINAKYEPETFLDYLHHELTEGATFIIGCSYTKFYPDKEEMFFMTHSQMDLVSSAVRGAYEEIKKKLGIKDTSVNLTKKTRKAQSSRNKTERNKTK